MLDSIQFLFDFGFVARVALPPSYSRAAVVETVRRQIDNVGDVGARAGKGLMLALQAWPRGSAAAAADVMGGGGAAAAGVEEGEGATALGLRILSTSRLGMWIVVNTNHELEWKSARTVVFSLRVQ